MSDLTAGEQRLQNVLGELQGAPDIRIHAAKPGAVDPARADVDATFAGFTETTGVVLDPRLKTCFLRFGRISARWRLETSPNRLSGEFNVMHMSDVATTEAPPTDLDSLTSAEKELYREFRVIDDQPESGTGAFTALRLRPGTPNPEIWHHYFHVGGFKLDVDYCQYLEALAITKGTIGWQYLFCDVSFEDDDFIEVADDMQEMLDVFPGLFPDHDYTDLRARLEERL
ncbi:hypothetical protein J7E87_05445 [Streptomyces sp. ISL-1]|uniref:hypothetical protein n=1 Tax=Streptomyces sp. ISL-1 TaxID=2817657 RepID=UPI001BE78CAE|nr:hypothetical protein [Streptomyces sp. ISL-1]MBT2388879.1 hypothetical protein [Streptomyces sp. ISL-1]